MRIAVVGAGVSGIAAARVLDAVHHDVTVYEACPDVGGVWSETRAYPGLGLQSDKRAYAFLDHPMPDDYPRYPDRAQVQAYVQEYVEHCGLSHRIRRGTSVRRISQGPGDAQWSLDLDGPAGSSTEVFDWIIVANGLFSRPHVPDLPGRSEFEQAGGVVTCPSETGDGSVYRDRDLVVLGWRKSAADIATAAVPSARSVRVVARSIAWKLPRKIGRLPWERLVLSRLGEHVLWSPPRTRLWARILLRLLGPVRLRLLRLVQRQVESQLELDRRDILPEQSIQFIDHLTTEGFLEAVDAGTITLHRRTNVVGLAAVDGRPRAVLSDGSDVACDVLLAATGYDQDVSIFAPDVHARLTEESGELHLFRHTVPTDVPRLAFVGWHGSFRSPATAQVQAMWVAALMEGLVPEPTTWARDRFTTIYRLTHRSAEQREVKQVAHAGATMGDIDTWLRETGLRLPSRVRLTELFAPMDPAAYGGLLDQLRHRLGNDPDPRVAEADAPGEVA